MRLETAEIDRYGPLYDCRPSLEDGISVISGPNEAGKTLYLEAVLQLLEPEVADMDPAPRVDQPPTGRVILEHAGTQYECGDDTSLSEITPIEPRHLQSVFVVQDSDLQLPTEQEYYTSLIEKLGDIHTTEINEIKSKLKERGRLTPTDLRISSSDAMDDAGTVQSNAESLALDIREYIEKIEEEDLDELEASRLRVKRQLQAAREDLDTQQEAEAAADYEHLSEQLDVYRSTSEDLADLEGYTRDTLDSLRESRNGLRRDREELADLEETIEEKDEEVEEAADELGSLEEQQSELKHREPAVDEARSELERYRDQQEEAIGAERQRSLTKSTTLIALLSAGGAGIAGAITGWLPAIGLGLALLLLSVGSGALYHRANRRLAAVEKARDTTVQAARDAGFDVETVEEIAPAIKSFDRELAKTNEDVAKADQKHQTLQKELEDLETKQSELAAEIEDQSDALSAQLEEAGVESIEEYTEQVEAREKLEPEQQAAMQSLVDRFGDPEAESLEEKVTVWKQKLEALVADVNLDEVDAETYDEDRQETLEQRINRLTEECDQLEAKLGEHDDQLDTFDTHARSLNTQPFIGRGLELEARSKDGLEALATEVEKVCKKIEEDAELSRKALKIFKQIESREEQKLTNLFDPDGPASRTFEQLTGGRYSEVAYDAENHEIVVERHDGRKFNPTKLSQGTMDQLYFATRVSLAQQLLGSTSGFLLLDDPFLAADPDRLHQGFQTLQDLADDGWQILYLTAKREVSETMVNEFDLQHSEMEPRTPRPQEI